MLRCIFPANSPCFDDNNAFLGACVFILSNYKKLRREMEIFEWKFQSIH
jgi:hypothetical protein